MGNEDCWAWNKTDKSCQVRLRDPEQRIALFHPYCSTGSAGVRGTKALINGHHYWEISINERIFGTSIMLGLATKEARLHLSGYVNLMGRDEYSWGLSHKGLLWHAGQHRPYTEAFKEFTPTTIGLYYDSILGTLSYFKDGVNLGVAFSGLQNVAEPLYPMVCSTAAKTEMALRTQRRDFQSLQDRCRASLLSCITHRRQVEQLKLPIIVKRFITEELKDSYENTIFTTRYGDNCTDNV